MKDTTEDLHKWRDNYVLGYKKLIHKHQFSTTWCTRFYSNQSLNIEVKKPRLKFIWRKQRTNAKIFLKKNRLEEFVFSVTVNLCMNLQVVTFPRWERAFHQCQTGVKLQLALRLLPPLPPPVRNASCLLMPASVC